MLEITASLIVGLIIGALATYALTKQNAPKIYLDNDQIAKTILETIEFEIAKESASNDNCDRATKENFMDWWSLNVEQKRGSMTLATSIEKEFAKHCKTLGLIPPNVAVIGRWVRCIQPRVKTSRKENKTHFHHVKIKTQMQKLAA